MPSSITIAAFLATSVLATLVLAACGTTTSGEATTTVPPCPAFEGAFETGRVADPDLAELSGIAAGRASPGVLWVHQDSGDDAVVYALDTAGRTLGRFRLGEWVPRDNEDIALGPGPEPDRTYLYVGDIGDNSVIRPQVRVYRSPEPVVDPGAPAGDGVLPTDRLTFVYPDGPHDAEALMVDADGALYIVTKEDGDEAYLYGAPAPHDPADRTTLESLGPVSTGSEGTVTAGDIAPDGSGVVLRSYGSGWWWDRAAGTPLADTLSRDPCDVPLGIEFQGEAIGLDGTSAVVTVSEATNPPLYRTDRVP